MRHRLRLKSGVMATDIPALVEAEVRKIMAANIPALVAAEVRRVMAAEIAALVQVEVLSMSIKRRGSRQFPCHS